MIRTDSRFLRPALIAVAAIAASVSVASGQSVTLEIRPRVGDTLSIRMDQLVEMTGTTRGDTARSHAMETVVFTRAVPERRLINGTIVVGIADSVVMLPRVQGGAARTQRLGGNSTRMLIQQNGAVDILQSKSNSEDLRELFGQLPAMMPDDPIYVRGKWTREMPVPLSGDIHGTGWVRTTFTLDSLSKSREIAFITLKGFLTHERLKDEAGERDANGTITGAIQLNRRLGWITDSKMTIVLESVVLSSAAGRKPNASDRMKVRTKIVQRVRAAAK